MRLGTLRQGNQIGTEWNFKINAIIEKKKRVKEMKDVLKEIREEEHTGELIFDRKTLYNYLYL